MGFSTVACTQAQAMQASFFVLLPSILLSGFMFPSEAMPDFAHALGLPLTYYLQAMRGIILKGVGLESLWPQTLALAGFAVLVLPFALRVQRFNEQLE